MKMIEALFVDPTNQTTEIVKVDIEDYDAIQALIGDKSYEELTLLHSASSIGNPKPFLRLFMDATAKLSGEKDRFILPSFNMHGGPVIVHGKALIVAAKGEHVTSNRGRLETVEVMWPNERRVTKLDEDFRSTGYFIPQRAGAEGARVSRAGEDGNLNFQTILSDERFVAATRIILTTFEDDIDRAIGSGGGLPMLELKINRSRINEALDLYDELVREFGYVEDLEEEEA